MLRPNCSPGAQLLLTSRATKTVEVVYLREGRERGKEGGLKGGRCEEGERERERERE